MTGRLLLDLTHTSHTRARTGIQRVVRSLQRELGPAAIGVTHDPYLGDWRALESWEESNLAATTPGSRRGATWPWTARLRGRWRRALGRQRARPSGEGIAGFLTAEIFSPAVGTQLPAVHPRVAVFHDAIALRLPELSPRGTVTRFPGYLVELLAFDGIAAVSEDSRDALLDYWRWLGVAGHPPVVALPLGVDPLSPPARPSVPSASVPVILCVGTIEGRKNHLALLEACADLWARGAAFELRVVGSVQAETGRVALDRLRALQAAGHRLRYDGPLDDRALDAAYAECAFTVYPSLAEGFGLPVIESLVRGRPCVCLGRGALGEQARGGGCVVLESVDRAALAKAIGDLLASPPTLASLAEAARGRTFKSWSTYASELVGWMDTLKPA